MLAEPKKSATSGKVLFAGYRFADVSRSNFRNESRPRSQMLDRGNTSTITKTEDEIVQAYLPWSTETKRNIKVQKKKICRSEINWWLPSMGGTDNYYYVIIYSRCSGFSIKFTSIFVLFIYLIS